ncbi:MAG: box helicase protein, partial [Actinomycetota bacterium]|nr:box helicase protein [Actinomycetota bacterium]
RAIDQLRAGSHVVVATGTASGKSLCYQVPIVESVVAGTRDTAILIFPTKALAQLWVVGQGGQRVGGVHALSSVDL